MQIDSLKCLTSLCDIFCLLCCAVRLSLDTAAIDSDEDQEDDDEQQSGLFQSSQQQSDSFSAGPGDEPDGFSLRVNSHSVTNQKAFINTSLALCQCWLRISVKFLKKSWEPEPLRKRTNFPEKYLLLVLTCIFFVLHVIYNIAPFLNADFKIVLSHPLPLQSLKSSWETFFLEAHL